MQDMKFKGSSWPTEPETYVLTEAQYLEALVRGAAALGIIPEERLQACEGFFAEGNPAADVTLLANGVTLNFGFEAPATIGEVLNQPRSSGGIPGLTAPAQEFVEGPKMALKAPNEGPAPEKVKEALVKVLGTQTPLITTIAKWDAKQRRAAVKWAKDGGNEVTRPEHVVPKAKRGSRQAVEPSGPEPARNGASVRRGFGDDEDEESSLS